MRLPPEIEAQLAERREMIAAQERTTAEIAELRKQVMRSTGEPVREDFTNRHEYRAAVKKFRAKTGGRS